MFAGDGGLRDSQGNLAEETESVHLRLYNKALNSDKKGDEEQEHKPQINRNSEQIVQLMKEADGAKSH